MFRTAKTDTVLDEFRVLITGLVLSILILMSERPAIYYWDKLVAEKPFVTATLRIVSDPTGAIQPFFLYDADATQKVESQWIGTIEGPSGERFATRRGVGSYTDAEDDPKLWTWNAFFDTEDGQEIPEVPTTSFKVCLRYISTARDSGYKDETPLTCSPVYNPNE